MSQNLIIFLIVVTVIGMISILYLIFRSPFKYPYFKYSFDVSGKRQPDINDWIDNFIIRGNFSLIKEHNKKIEQWKIECQNLIEKSKLKNYRNKQYKKVLDDSEAYIFYLTREQTRYKQINYIKTPYKVINTVDSFSCDYKYLVNRDKQLKAINYECTINDYNKKQQRKLMTDDLKQKIKIRDNFTCQYCGKYMPDEVGLHIDHIIPISKGGKSISSNLQILCSKCNGKKSNK